MIIRLPIRGEIRTTIRMAAALGIPPEFPTDPTNPSTALVWLDGSNADATHKADKINGYNFQAVEAPCATLATNDTISMKGHGILTGKMGTASLNYDGTNVTVTSSGTLFKLQFSDGTTWPICEGAGTAGNNLTVRDTTGKHTGTITAAASATVVWGATQDEYFDGMIRGWYEDTTVNDGLYYPSNPETPTVNMLQMSITGGGTLTVNGTAYQAAGSPHTIEGLTSAAQAITAAYGAGGDNTIAFSGDTVSGSYPDYTIDMSSSKVIAGAFSMTTYSLTLGVAGDSTITINGSSYTSAGSPHTITGLANNTTITVGYGGDDNRTTWSGSDLADISGNYPTYVIDMNENKSLSVLTDEIPYTLTLSVSGDSTFTIAGTNYTKAGSPHTITNLLHATPITVTYSGTEDKTDWSGADFADVTGSSPNFSIDMDEDKVITGAFSTAVYTLNMSLSGNSTITSNGTNYTAAGSPHAITGQHGDVPLVATYTGGENAVAWSGDTVTGSDPNYSIAMGSADKTITGAFSVASVGSANLFTATMKLDGKIGGAFDFGTDASPKFHMQVTSKSWTPAGVETTATRTVYGKKVRRKPYPNQTEREEVQDGSKVEVQIILSDFIYAGDVITDITFEAGLFTDNGTGGTGGTNAKIVNANADNNSTDAYPKCMGTWLNHDLDRAESNNYTIRLLPGQRYFQDGKTVQAVKFIATDAHSNTTSTIVTSMSKVSYTASGLSASCFEGNLDFTGLTQGDMITIDAEIYPFIGDMYKISVDGASYPSPNLTVLKVLNDRAGAYGKAYAYVDGTGGGTPQVSTTEATAQANPYDTVKNAAAAIQSFNNTNYSRNSASGGVIKLTTATHVHASFSSVVTDTIPLVIEGVDRATSIYQDAGSSTSRSCPALCKWSNMTLQKTANVTFLDTDVNVTGFSVTIFDHITWDAQGLGVNNNWIYGAGTMWMIESDGDNLGQAENYSTRKKNVISIGCGDKCSIGKATYNIVGVKASDNTFSAGRYGLANSPDAIGVMAAFCHITASGYCISRAGSLDGLSIIGCVLEKTTTTNPAIAVSTDNESVFNLVTYGNTIVGARTNLLYQDSGTTYIYKDGIDSNSVHDTSCNCKSDVFGTNGNLTGNWNFVNRVGSKHRAMLRDGGQPAQGSVGAWSGEVIAVGDVQGTDAAPLSADWVNDAGSHGTALGNGDYTPGASTALPQIPAGETAFPFDQKGRAVPTDGTAYVGAIQKA